MIKKMLFGIMLLVLTLTLIACNSAAPATTSAPVATTGAPPAATTTAPVQPTQTATVPPVTTQAAAVKPTEIIFAHTTGATQGICILAKQMGDNIEKESGGKLKFVYYWANALMPQAELFNGLQGGIATMAYYPLSVDYMPLSYGVMGLPYMGYRSMSQGTSIFWQLYNKFPEMQAEFSTVKLLAARSMSGMQLHMTKKANIKLPVDIKGMKLAISGEPAKVATAMGAAPVYVSTQDVYMSLNSGLVDGVVNHFPYINAFGCLPAVPYHTIFGDGGMAMYPDLLIANSAAFNKLSPDIQKIITDQAKWYQDQLVVVSQSEIDRAINTCKGLNQTFYNLTAQEAAQWSVYAEPNHKQWIKDMTAKGKPAQVIYDEAKKLIASTAP